MVWHNFRCLICVFTVVITIKADRCIETVYYTTVESVCVCCVPASGSCASGCNATSATTAGIPSTSDPSGLTATDKRRDADASLYCVARDIPNGIRAPNATKFIVGQWVTYRCEKGFKLASASQMLDCIFDALMEKAVWQPSVPECKPKTDSDLILELGLLRCNQSTYFMAECQGVACLAVKQSWRRPMLDCADTGLDIVTCKRQYAHACDVCYTDYCNGNVTIATVRSSTMLIIAVTMLLVAKLL